MQGFLLYIVAVALVIICIVPCLIFGTVKSIFTNAGNKYYRNMAESLDMFGNVAGQYLWNAIFIYKVSANKFGKPKEKMSSVFGKNRRDNTLTKLGYFIAVRVLDQWDTNHVEDAIDNNV